MNKVLKIIEKFLSVLENSLRGTFKNIGITFVVSALLLTGCSGTSSESTGSETEIEEEEEVELAYLESTDASDYFENMLGFLYEENEYSIPDSTTKSELTIYEDNTDDYTIYIEASIDTDEIHYVKIEVINWSKEVSGTNLIYGSMIRLDVEDLELTNALNFVNTNLTGDEPEVTETVEDNLDTDILTVRLSPSDDYECIFEIEAI